MEATVKKQKEPIKIESHTVFVMNGMGKRKNGPIREDTIGSRNPIYLGANRTFILPMTSRHYLGEGKGFINTQYIPGANTIYVADYVDENGVMQKGLKNQGYELDKEREMSTRLGIGFSYGIMDIKKFGRSPLLEQFVNTHESNSESSAGKNPDPRINRLIRFEPLKAEEKAIKRTASFEEGMAGMDIVRSLRQKQADGSFKYDEAKMNALVGILGITNKFSATDFNQKFDIILTFANTDPIEFAKIVEGTINEVKLMLAKAITSEVITMSIKDVKMKNVLVYTFAKGIDETDRITHLTYYLLGDTTAKPHYLDIKANTAAI